VWSADWLTRSTIEVRPLPVYTIVVLIFYVQCQDVFDIDLTAHTDA
jgi:hypothetical protein